jgi:hypothetical protein
VGGLRFFSYNFDVPTMFPVISNDVPHLYSSSSHSCSLISSPIAPHFYPISFAQTFALVKNIARPKDKAVWGRLIMQLFFKFWAITNTHIC